MKYFLDFEFIEHFVKVGTFKTRSVHTIEPIQLGLVSEDGRKLDLMFNDFDIKAVWQHEWLNKNVVKPYYDNDPHVKTGFRMGFNIEFNYKWFKKFIKDNGVTKKQAVKKVEEFCKEITLKELNADETYKQRSAPEFYAYFADYDWVAFCQLFGTMMDLPTKFGFPKYCNDLKQILEDKAKQRNTTSENIKKRKDYPKQAKEHHALDDALFNFNLYQFLIKL